MICAAVGGGRAAGAKMGHKVKKAGGPNDGHLNPPPDIFPSVT